MEVKTKVPIQDLPGGCNFIYRGEFLSNGWGHYLTYDWESHLRGMPYCTFRCANGYAVYVDLPGETLVEPVSVSVASYPIPYEEYKTRFT